MSQYRVIIFFRNLTAVCDYIERRSIQENVQFYLELDYVESRRIEIFI